jgi:hypothetical protein
MSAYMPVKHNWSLGALLPSRWGFSRSSRLLSISIFTAAAIVLTLFSLFRFGTVELKNFPLPLRARPSPLGQISPGIMALSSYRVKQATGGIKYFGTWRRP